MAGNPSFFSTDDYQQTYSEELSFDFIFEGVSVDANKKTEYFSVKTYAEVSGEIEFFPKKPITYWRSTIAWSLFLGLLVTGAFYITNFDRHKVAARLSKVMKAEPVLTVPKAETKEAPITQALLAEPLSEDIVEEVFIPSTESTKPVLEPVLAEPEVSALEEPTPEVIARVAPKVNQAKPKGFKTNSLTRAKELSESTGRYVFIKFGAKWCAPCKLMEQTALQDETIVSLLEEKFVVLDVDVDELDGMMIKQSFYVDRLPTLIILDELGNQIRRKETGFGTTNLIEMLESVVPYIYLEEEVLTADVEIVGKSE